MATYTGTIKLSDIERIEIYDKKTKNTKAGMKKILQDTGGDIVMTGPIFLKSYKACCHLKANGVVKCNPGYQAWCISWDTPINFAVRAIPKTGAPYANYMECVHAIIDGKKIAKMNYGEDMAYECNRLAVGTKKGQFAYLATENNLTPEGLRDFCYKDGWDYCIMMDGGGTPAILFADGTGFAGDGRYVPFWIVIHLKNKICPYKEPKITIKRGSKGEGASWTQWQLNRHGANLIVDGKFGELSEKALVAFQKTAFPNGPEKEWDGKCGSKTREALKR